MTPMTLLACTLIRIWRVLSTSMRFGGPLEWGWIGVALVRRAQVAGPTVEVRGRPTAFWKARTASPTGAEYVVVGPWTCTPSSARRRTRPATSAPLEPKPRGRAVERSGAFALAA